MPVRQPIIIEPREGLCNRMRTLDAAVALSRKLNRPLIINWRMDDRLNCRLSELFDYKDGHGQIEEHLYLGLFHRLRRRARIAVLQLTGGIYLQQATVEAYLREGRSFEDLKDSRKIFISTWDQFYPSNQLAQNFVPVKALLTKIEALTLDKDNLVGVHIRRTDHGPSSERSPLWRFVELMDEEIRHDPGVQFFVASDSHADEARLLDRFPGRIITHPKKSLDRNDPRAIKDAVVDLYCLAACRKLLGSYRSSFSDVAWKLRGIDRVIVDIHSDGESNSDRV